MAGAAYRSLLFFPKEVFGARRAAEVSALRLPGIILRYLPRSLTSASPSALYKRLTPTTT